VQGGGVGAMATATPVVLRFDPGDGTPAVACRGAGTAFDPARYGLHAASPTCDHIYPRSSFGAPGEQATATYEISWRVSWTGWTGTGPASGSLPALVSRATARFAVAEAQALVTGGEGGVTMQARATAAFPAAGSGVGEGPAARGEVAAGGRRGGPGGAGVGGGGAGGRAVGAGGGDRVLVRAVARPVPVGQQITEADVMVVQLATTPGLGTVPAGRRAEVVGRYAAVGLRPGSLFTTDAVSDQRAPTAGQAVLAVAVKTGLVPARGLVPGGRVVLGPGNRGRAGPPAAARCRARPVP